MPRTYDAGEVEITSLHSEFMSNSETIATKLSSSNRKWKQWLCCCIPSNDLGNILLLMFLYVLQGIPMGLTRSVPYILSSRQASYAQQGTFSLSTWPFSLKLLWAPLVDSIYWSRVGRRKSWLIPVQYVMGLTMLVVSFQVEDWLGEETFLQPFHFNNSLNTSKSNSTASDANIQILPLTISFFCLWFLSATQDIAVDGWAITMLHKNNVGWASTSNSIGQSFGSFLAFVLFLSLNSKDFCNRWLRSNPKPYEIVTFGEFILSWSIIVLVANTLVMIFKRERARQEDSIGNNKEMDDQSITTEVSVTTNISQGDTVVLTNEKLIDLSEFLGPIDTYKMVWKILSLRPIQLYLLTLFATQIGLSALNSLTDLKMIEHGVAKETMAIAGSLTTPVQILIPFLTGKWVSGKRPLSYFAGLCCFYTLFGLVIATFVHFIPSFRQPSGEFAYYFFGLLCLSDAALQVFNSIVFVLIVAFHAKISDPLIGGTYMTFLNTACNLASRLPNTLVMYIVDPLSKKTCISGMYQNSSCLGPQAYKQCVSNNGECVTDVEGYYILIGGCAVVGVIATVSVFRIVRRLETMQPQTWHVVPRK